MFRDRYGSCKGLAETVNKLENRYASIVVKAMKENRRTKDAIMTGFTIAYNLKLSKSYHCLNKMTVEFYSLRRLRNKTHVYAYNYVKDTQNDQTLYSFCVEVLQLVYQLMLHCTVSNFDS